MVTSASNEFEQSYKRSHNALKHVSSRKGHHIIALIVNVPEKNSLIEQTNLRIQIRIIRNTGI